MFSKTTIGNLGAVPPDLQSATSKEHALAMIRNRKIMIGDTEYEMTKFTTFFGLLDAFSVIGFFVWAFVYRKKYLIDTIEVHDVKNVTPNDYAVHIHNLPPKIWRNGHCLSLLEYEESLREHIGGILAANVRRYRKGAMEALREKKKLERARAAIKVGVVPIVWHRRF